MPFTFKQFHIDDHNCGMRVSTDAIVLGAWAQLVTAKRILDIGAGSGLLSIMAAQRSEAMIIGVEIDSKACEAAKGNCSNSPWGKRLIVANQSIEDFTEEHIHLERNLFDHVICNPPYFVSGPQSCDAKRADARHTNSLTFDVLVTKIECLLQLSGKASLILPVESLQYFENALDHSPWSVNRKQWVVSVRGKQPNRVLLEIGFNAVSNIKMPPLVIREKTGEYSKEMITLTKAFYLKL